MLFYLNKTYFFLAGVAERRKPSLNRLGPCANDYKIPQKLKPVKKKD